MFRSGICTLVSGLIIGAVAGKSTGPLFLSPFIHSNEINTARKLAAVNPPIAGIESYSGLLTVDKANDANLFFWYFPCKRNSENTPTVIWLNGWGTASTYGLFTQSGPYYIKEGRVELRKDSWHKMYNMLYIDSPVGTGYSFTTTPKGYPKNVSQVGLHLHKAVHQIIKLFPQLSKTKFYISALSYAGKYGPALADHLINSDPKINLAGLFLGNPLSDPLTQTTWGSYLYEIGLINEKSMHYFKHKENAAHSMIRAGNNLAGLQILMELMFSEVNSYFFNVTGLPHYYNYVDFAEVSTSWMDYIRQPDVREAIHVGDLEFLDGSLGVRSQSEDILNSVKPILEKLLSKNVKILFYNGQLDIIAAYPMMARMVRDLAWPGQAAFAESPRVPWWDATDLVGYVQYHGPLIEVLVRNAGHMVAQDLPHRSLQLMQMFDSDAFPKN